MAQLGKKIEGFPQTQTEMAEWQQKYVFDIGTKDWYEKTETNFEIPENRVEGAGDVIDKATTTGNGTFNDVSAYDEYVKAQQAQLDEMSKQITEAQKKQTGLISQFMDRPKVDVAGEVAKLQEQFQIPEDIEAIRGLTTELGALNTQMATIQASKQAAMDRIEQRPGIGMEFMTNEQKRIEREYDRRLSAVAAQVNAKAMTIDATRGNITQARALISDTVQALMYDTNQNRQDIRDFIDIYGDQIADLKGDYQNILNDTKDFWEKQADREYAEHTSVLNLMLDNPNAGIVATDTLEEAVEKVKEAGGAAEEAPTTREIGGTLYQWNEQTKVWEKAPGVPAGAGNITTEQELMPIIDRFLSARVGADGLVSAETYRQAHKEWTTRGGVNADWNLLYPPESVMRSEEIKRLRELYPSVYKTPRGEEIDNEDLI